MNKRINNNPSSKSIGEYLSKDITDFQRVSRTLFEYFSSLATGALLNPQQILQQQQLLSNTSQPNETTQSNISTPAMVLQLMNHLIDVDKNYQNSLKKLEKHQKIQKEITDIQKEIEEKDKLISTLASNLKDIESFLENELSQGNVNLNSGSGDNNIVNEVLIVDSIKEQVDDSTSNFIESIREVSPEDLISYAHKISGTTSAPFGYQPNAQLASLFKPPAPQDEMMRSSVLFTKPPPHVLKYYGLAEIDVSTPTIQNISSPISVTNQDGTSTTSPTLSGTKDQDQLSQHTITELEIQPIQSIITPQPPQQLNIDLDLNPDLDSSEEDDDDEDEDESDNEEIAWD